METLYFTLGIASVVVTVVTVGAVWAMFKVAKLTSMLRDVEQQFGSTHHDITMVEKTVMNTIDNAISETAGHTDTRCDHIERTIDNVISELTAHTDSRVDKVAAKLEKMENALSIK